MTSPIVSSLSASRFLDGLGQPAPNGFLVFCSGLKKSRHQATLGNATLKDVNKVNKLSIFIHQQHWVQCVSLVFRFFDHCLNIPWTSISQWFNISQWLLVLLPRQAVSCVKGKLKAHLEGIHETLMLRLLNTCKKHTDSHQEVAHQQRWVFRSTNY